MKRHLIIFAFVIAAMACVGCANQNEDGSFAELRRKPQVGTWYKVTPKGAVTSTGDQWNGFYRKGTENKVIVYFFGGGVSVDEYTAARGASCAPGDLFYFDKLGENNGEGFVALLCNGLGSADETNPFKDWTIVAIPYTTGDFHCGTGERQYTSLNGEQKTIYYHGYTNFTKFMKKVKPFVGTPDAVLITGSSAGGFGTAILSEDVVGYFPKTKNITSVVDASVLISENWKQIAQDEWQTPEHIVARICGDNLTLDCLKALHKDKPYVKIMFGVTKRDAVLTYFQHYFVDGTRPASTEADGEAFQQIIKKMAEDLQENNPEVGLNIWDDGKTNELGLTTHTIECTPNVFVNFNGQCSYAGWIMNAVNGKVEKLGLELLD